MGYGEGRLQAELVDCARVDFAIGSVVELAVEGPPLFSLGQIFLLTVGQGGARAS